MHILQKIDIFLRQLMEVKVISPKCLGQSKKLIQGRRQVLTEPLGHQGIAVFQLTGQRELLEEEKWNGTVGDHNPWAELLGRRKT